MAPSVSKFCTTPTLSSASSPTETRSATAQGPALHWVIFSLHLGARVSRPSEGGALLL